MAVFKVVVLRSGDNNNLVVSVYDSNGLKVYEKLVNGQHVVIIGAGEVSVVQDLSGYGVVAEYEVKPCIEERGSKFMVKKCGTSGGEE